MSDSPRLWHPASKARQAGKVRCDTAGTSCSRSGAMRHGTPAAGHASGEDLSTRNPVISPRSSDIKPYPARAVKHASGGRTKGGPIAIQWLPLLRGSPRLFRLHPEPPNRKASGHVHQVRIRQLVRRLTCRVRRQHIVQHRGGVLQHVHRHAGGNLNAFGL